ncbi:MAG: DUF805 domain-containing protein [Aquificaceae bacterium]|nr:MAG: DUF805 domain-containing protein [Aquificaceae bacterium]
MEEKNNPYATPNAVVRDVASEEGFGDLKLFTSQGRLGRLRYLLYTLGVTLVGGILAALLALIPVVGVFLAAIIYIGLLVITFFLTIQRCHDFNATGWFSLVILIPIVSLVFYFIPGTKASNKYGLQPPPNSKGVKIGAFLILAFFVIAIAASILMPLLVQPQG